MFIGINGGYFPAIFSHFSEFLPKILSILVKYVKIVNNSTVDFIFKDKKVLLIVLI